MKNLITLNQKSELDNLIFKIKYLNFKEKERFCRELSFSFDFDVFYLPKMLKIHHNDIKDVINSKINERIEFYDSNNNIAVTYDVREQILIDHTDDIEVDISED